MPVRRGTIRGDVNVPPVSDGRCSLVGTWDVLTAQDGSNPPSHASFTFDALGHWVGGAYGADVCATLFMYGTYELTSQQFQIVTSYGMGCPAAFGSGYSMQFDASCTAATLHDVFDNCTGGRRYLMIDSTMKKR